MIPKLFGFPLWYGKIKNRVAKKHLYYNIKALLHYYKEFASYKPGDFVNDCTGFNRKILNIYPRYYKVSNGFVLSDVDIYNDQGGCCSLCSCGVQPKLLVEEIESKTLEFIREWTLGPDGEHWYGKNSEDYKKVVERAHKVIEVIESGRHITDADGQMLEEFRIKI